MKKICLIALAFAFTFAGCKKSSNNDDQSTPCTLEAAFTSSVDQAGEQIKFTNTTIGGAIYTWTFGDNKTSNLQNPTHKYSEAGDFTVKLVVTSADGKCTSEKTRTVNVPISIVPVEEKNRAMLFDFSEDWCPPCGAYGGPAFDACMALEENTISLMKIYSSSNNSALNCSAGNALSSDYNVQGIPDFYVNGDELASGGGVYSSATANYNWVNGKATAFAATAVNAGILLEKSFSGNTITVNAKVQFFIAQSAGKDFKLAIYVLEDDIISAQQVTGQGSVATYEHHNLLRALNAPTYKGDALNSMAAITQDQVFNKTYTINLNTAWKKDDMKVIGVVWNTTASGKPTLVNSFMIH